MVRNRTAGSGTKNHPLYPWSTRLLLAWPDALQYGAGSASEDQRRPTFFNATYHRPSSQRSSSEEEAVCWGAFARRSPLPARAAPCAAADRSRSSPASATRPASRLRPEKRHRSPRGHPLPSALAPAAPALRQPYRPPPGLRRGQRGHRRGAAPAPAPLTSGTGRASGARRGPLSAPAGDRPVRSGRGGQRAHRRGAALRGDGACGRSGYGAVRGGCRREPPRLGEHLRRKPNGARRGGLPDRPRWLRRALSCLSVGKRCARH